MTSYTRQSSFSDGDTITAALFNNEYNQLLNAFAYASSGTTGHQHDGGAGEGGNIHTIGDQNFLNKIVVDSTNNRWGIFVEVSSSAVEQIRIQDGAIVPVTDNDIDLGTSSLEFKDGYFDGTVYADAINFNGTAITATAAELNIMDGVTSTAAELNILDGVTASATDINLIDGITNGTVIASKAIITDSNKDISGGRNITISGELDAATLDVSGNADIDGTTNLDEVDIDGTVQIDGVTTFGVDDTGVDVKFFGATSGAYLLWDESADKLLTAGSTTIDIVKDKLLIGSTAVTTTAAELNILDGVTSTTAELNILDGVTSTASELNILDGVTSTASELNILDGVTSTTAELNILDGVTSTTAELNILDGVTATASEINLIDGDTSRGTTAVASGDGILINDAGTMRMTDVDTVSTYFSSHNVGGGNIVTTGALNSGSITSGFGAIDNGSSNISTTGTVTFGSITDGTITATAFVDEDDMSSDSATLIPTQQSVKAYVDGQDFAATSFVMEDGDGTEVTITKNKEMKFVEGGGIDINWTDTDNGTDGDPYDLTFTINAAQTDITSIHATDLIIGEDAQTAIDFGTANEIDFKVDNAARLTLTSGALYPVTNNQIDLGTSSLEFKDAYFDGTVTADAFAGPLTGNVTGNVSGTAATVTGAAQSNITSLGTLTALTVDNVVINGATIGHGDDTDLMTVADGVLTVAGEVSMTTLDIGGTNVTSTAAELNILDGVTSTAAELNYLDITTLGTTQASKAVTTDSNGDVVFLDGDKINLGTGSDLVLQHDGSHSYIQNSTGNLNLQGKSGEDSIVLAPDGAVTLYYDNVAKLATTSTGASITTSADTSAGLRISRASGGGIVDIESYNAIGGIGTSDNIPFRFNTNNTERVRILNDGKVGIGTSSPSTPLHVNGDVTVAGGIAGATSISGGALGGRRNAIYNPTFSVNQRHGTGANTTMNTYAMDRWRCFGGGSGQAHSWTTRSDAGEGDGYYSRFQRPAGNTATAQMGIAQGLETIDSRYFAGKEVTLSFRARGGANWSPTSGNVGFHLVGGEGTDENPVSMTNTDTIIGITAGIPQGGGFVQYSGTATVPADKTQLALQISWATVGTAGANDYWDLREVQLELGDTVTQFEQRTYGEEFQLCQRYFEKSDDPVFHINCGAAASQVQRLSIRYATQKMKDATLVVSSSTSGLSGVVTNGVDGFTLGFSGSDLDVHHNTFTAEAEL